MNLQTGAIIGIDKPYGMTSFGTLARVRYLLSQKMGVKRIKIGHAGTLDPLATGVLVLCTGKATKRIDELQAHTKEYIAVLQLGATTPSYDMEHEVDATFPTEHITDDAVIRVLTTFKGDIMQVPPGYSACKIDGKRAYDLKRKGQEVNLSPKPIRIDDIQILQFDRQAMLLTLQVICGKGTYIRALARDIGRKLNSGAYLTNLRRTRVGDVDVNQCITLDGFPEWLEEQEIEPWTK